MRSILLLSVTALWGTWVGTREEPAFGFRISDFGFRIFLIPQSAICNPQDVQAVATFNQSYQRTHSQVMMRLVRQPTRAQLDFAAYDRNILFHVPKPEPVTAPSPRPKLADLHFGGALVPGSLKDRLAQTPLTEEEQREPLAVTPLLDYLAVWNFEAAEKLLRCAARVSGEKWGNQDYPRPLQRMATAYLHTGEGGAVELWAKVEFEPVVTFLEGVTDEDGDGYPEIYGQVDPEAITVPLVEHIRRDYLARRLTPEEVETYFFELSSAWYRALQTVALEPQERCPWPNPETEPEVRQEIGDLVLQQPTAVIRGKPFGLPLYNVFLVSSLPASPPQGTEGDGRGWKGETQRHPDTQTPRHPDTQTPTYHTVDRIRHELQQWGEGSWATWEERLSGFRQDVRRLLASQPEEVKGLVGRDGFLFFRGSLEYVLAGDLRQQPDGRDPYPAIVDYHQQLQAKGINLLLVIIPAKPEVFPEKVSAQAPPGGKPYVTPYTRKLLLELAEAGVESVDLLPAFLEARDLSFPTADCLDPDNPKSEIRNPKSEGGDEEPFYLPLDTHWSHRALRLAAHLIAERVRQYPWFQEVCPQPIPYQTKGVQTVRAGDIRGMLPDEEKLKYRPMTLTAQQVLQPDGSFYEDDPNSPIVLLGDSFCGVFHFEDCQHAGLSAHLARELGLPIDLIMAHGSGPRIRVQLARRGAEAIRRKKLVIWTVVARDLYHYWAPWEKVRVP